MPEGNDKLLEQYKAKVQKILDDAGNYYKPSKPGSDESESLINRAEGRTIPEPPSGYDQNRTEESSRDPSMEWPDHYADDPNPPDHYAQPGGNVPPGEAPPEDGVPPDEMLPPDEMVPN